MRQWFAATALTVASVAQAQSPAGPLPAEAQVLPAEGFLMGLDARALFGSNTWSQLASGNLAGLAEAMPKDQANKMQGELRGNIAKGLAEAEQKLGLRLDRDIDRLAMVVGGLREKEPLIAIVAVGRFDPLRIGAALEASQKASGATPAHRSVEGAPLLIWDKAGKPDFAASIGTSSAIVGSPGMVERAVQNRARKVNALAAAAPLLALVKGVRPDAGLWMVADEAVLDKAKPAPGAPPPPFPLPRSVTLAAQFDGGLELAGEMADEATAKNFADLVRGGIAMGRMQAAQQAATPEQAQQKAMVDFLSSVQVEQQARTVRISSSAAGGGTAGIGLVAALAIPSLLRARVSANEAAAIGDIRTVISAEVAYSSVNDGAYAPLPCLTEPKACIAGYAGPQFLDSSLTSLADRSGYKRAFFPGKPMRSGSKSLSDFAYTATPLESGKTGVRSFCGDSSGVVCADPMGAVIQPVGGACPKSCAPLR